MPLQAILFDLDDTLYPERDYVRSGFKAASLWAVHHLGIPTPPGEERLLELYAKGARHDTFNQWLALYDMSSTGYVSELVTVYREHIPSIRSYADTQKCLDYLAENYHLGLISDGYHGAQRKKIEALGLTHYFEVIELSDAIGPDAWKPSTKPYEAAVSKLGIAPRNAVYLGDNPIKDFLGARRAGMWSVRVRRAEGEHANIMPPTLEHEPDYCIHTLDQVSIALEHIERLGTENE